MTGETSFPDIPGFTIRRRLGWGGMGVVYEAVEDDLGRPVAIKTMPATGKWHRFRREMEALARLQHPGIVTLYGHGQTEDFYFYSMELVEGESVAVRLAERKQKKAPPDIPELREACCQVLQVARAIAYVHGKGVFHRDLTPANILLSTKGATKVIDFGLAEVADLATVTSSGTIFGTPPYLCPEVLFQKGGIEDVAGDIYSLGVILFELTTLSHPYPHRSIEDLFARMDSSEPGTPRKSNPAIPRSLQAVILKAIAKEPQNRYPSMDAFAADLENFLEGRPVNASRATTTSRIIGAIRRSSVLARAVAFALVFVLLLLGGYSFYSWRANRTRIDAFLEQARAAIREGNMEQAEEDLGLARELGGSSEAEEIERSMTLDLQAKRYKALRKEAEDLAGKKGTLAAESKFTELGRIRDAMLQAMKKGPIRHRPD
jgi:serine/threonine protein kinase